ncbi:hypothetical protein Val02_01600 [Virgisporangium aliadipatigenens]|uniref:MucB/RseB N-terminal domain-containing protein n=1 Tax=Virgisporangium aliadipatigenens TaxID=741659 RepID=A0A8J3YDT1_9ACTN|nr:hypothetical protein [Virgisporangium aliadipatigenens]GIJ43274.1 hypothetical protein Val02_01600 [Virgisporangium aliadipatigenens]
MSVARRETGRRWFLVAAGVSALAAVPAVLAARPQPASALGPADLVERVRRSGRVPFEGYAESVGVLGLPELPRLGAVTSLLSSNTRLRAWFGGPERWRVDVLEAGTERGTYRDADGVWSWDFARDEITYVPVSGEEHVALTPDGREITIMATPGESPGRLPRGADLLPSDLGRRLLGLAAGEPLAALHGRRVAGIDAAGVRITSADEHSTVGHLDVWADPDTGLPLQVELTARNAERPILATRFLDLALRTPAGSALARPERAADVALEGAGGNPADFFDWDPEGMPGTIAGKFAKEQPTVTDPSGQRWTRSDFSPFRVYGTGLTQFVVVAIPDRFGNDVYRAAADWGQPVQVSSGRAVILATPLVSVVVAQGEGRGRGRPTYLATGMVDGVFMDAVGKELAVLRR